MDNQADVIKALKQDKVLKQYAAQYKEQYRQKLNEFLLSQDPDAILGAVNKRYDASWSLEQLHAFLANCFDDKGNLLEALVPGNVIFDKVGVDAIQRCQNFIDVSGEELGLLDVVDEDNAHASLDERLSLRDKFLLDAMHQDLLGPLCTFAINDEDEITEPFVLAVQACLNDDEKYKFMRGFGMAGNFASQLVQQCCDEEKKLHFQALIGPGDGLVSACDALIDAVNNDVLLRLDLGVEDFEREIKEIGDVSRLFNTARFTLKIPEREALIDAFYTTNITNNETLKTNIDAGVNDLEEGFQDKYMEVSRTFFLNDANELHPDFEALLTDYGIKHQAFLNLVQKEFKLAYDLVFNSRGEIRPYIYEQVPEQLHSHDELKIQLLGAALQVTTAELSSKMNTEQAFTFSPLLGQFFNQQPLNALLANQQEQLFAFINNKPLPKSQVIVPTPTPWYSKSWVKYLASMTSGIVGGASIGAIAGGVVGSLVAGPGIGTALGAGIGAGMGASLGLSAGLAGVGLYQMVKAKTRGALLGLGALLVGSTGIGAIAGAVVGAVLGTLVLPGLGTLAGAAYGAGIGAGAGLFIGEIVALGASIAAFVGSKLKKPKEVTASSADYEMLSQEESTKVKDNPVGNGSYNYLSAAMPAGKYSSDHEVPQKKIDTQDEDNRMVVIEVGDSDDEDNDYVHNL